MAHHLQPADHPDAAPTGDGYGPTSLQSAYALPSSTAGSGQTVAVVDAYNDPDIFTDLETYRAAWGLPACGSGCFSIVNENGQVSPLPSPAAGTGWDVEESLDVDMVSAICPLCHITLVETNSPSFSDLESVWSSSSGGLSTMRTKAATCSPVTENLISMLSRMALEQGTPCVRAPSGTQPPPLASEAHAATTP